MRHVPTLVLMLMLVSLSGCATPTPYQPATPDGRDGYTVQRIETNRFRISFNGNSVTTRQMIDTDLLYLAAEVTVQNGFDYFVVFDRTIDKSTSYQTTPSSSAFGDSFGWGHRGYVSAFGGGGLTTPISEYDAIAEITAFKGQKPANDPQAYDARDVLAQLGPTILRPTKPQ
ncbi:MAG TPA: hypothetical protein VNT30_00140 [Stellaceae bacterium]|nr:hypothetical protein [Stellaceae bacterium]